MGLCDVCISHFGLDLCSKFHFLKPLHSQFYGSSWLRRANHSSITIATLLIGSIWRKPRGTAAMDGALWCFHKPFWLGSVLIMLIFEATSLTILWQFMAQKGQPQLNNHCNIAHRINMEEAKGYSSHGWGSVVFA